MQLVVDVKREISVFLLTWCELGCNFWQHKESQNISRAEHSDIYCGCGGTYRQKCEEHWRFGSMEANNRITMWLSSCDPDELWCGKCCEMSVNDTAVHWMRSTWRQWQIYVLNYNRRFPVSSSRRKTSVAWWSELCSLINNLFVSKNMIQYQKWKDTFNDLL